MKLRQFFQWIDENIITVLAAFLVVFIPLYPKIPLLDILPGYIVRVRLEDFLIAFTIFLYLVQVIRKKINLPKLPVSMGLAVYLVIGLISSIVAILFIHTVPLNDLRQVGKTFLHWLRRVEYFSLFFITFSSIRSKKILKIFLILVFLTLIAVTLYGYGQKYLYWCAFSTMNREFSKGWCLYLTDHSRVLSTFGGHYDLAGYLVILLSLAWSFFFGLKKNIHKLFVGLALAGGFWLLILTASRISFIAYLVGLSVVVFLWTFQKGVNWGVSRWLLAVFLSLVIMLSFGDLSDRFLRLLKLDTRINNLRAVLLSPTAQAPKNNNGSYLANNLADVADKTDIPPMARPADVTGLEAPLFIPQQTASGSVMVQKPRTYSQNAITYDLSTSIRLDATWPQAIRGFLANPVTGSGYATLTRGNINEFTDAESTDNDYLRSLGETGVLGFVAFFGAIGLLIVTGFKALGGIKDNYLYSLIAGFVALTIGLLVNATLIDIFEASKVAEVYWGVAGISIGAIWLYRTKIKEDRTPMRIEFSLRNFMGSIWKLIRTDRFLLIILLVLSISLRFWKLASPVADWHSWRQADTSAVTRNYDKVHKINWLYPVYDDISSTQTGKDNPMGFRFVEFPIYNVMSLVTKYVVADFSVEQAGRATTAITSTISGLFIFLIIRKIFGSRNGFMTALTYFFIPYNIFYGRVILPDPTMVMFSLGALWFGLKYCEEIQKRHLVLLVVFSSLALLVKPMAVFLLLPLGYFWLVKFRFNLKKWLVLSISLAIAAMPLLLWRYWIMQYPEGVPASDWLFNGNGIRFKGAFWYWLFADRIGRLILGYWGVVLLVFGLVRKQTVRYGLFPLILFLSSISYLIVFATGNVQHDYYQILITPSLAILVGLGLDFLVFNKTPGISPLIGRLISIIIILFSLGFGWYFVRDLYNINHPEIVEAGQKLQEITESYPNARVVAPYDGDTAFLYQTNRKGWPIMEGTIDDLIKKGADYYVSVRLDDATTRQILSKSWPVDKPNSRPATSTYKTLAQTDRYVLIQLVPDKNLPKD